jgi:FPC/CPF motif-containing protein YcgG
LFVHRINERADRRSRLFLRKGEVASSHAVSTWQSVMFSEFEAQMSSEARHFPCIFGVTGYRLDQLRYLFLDPFDIEVLGAQLAQFVAGSRSHGPNTSLVVFSRPRPVQTLDAYYRKMWLTLDQLARRDKSPSRHHHVARGHVSPIGGAG